VDVRELNLTHLRRSIGIVLQDIFLFRGNIRDNITMTRPNAGFDRIVAAAALAGADEFIERLPKGVQHLYRGERRQPNRPGSVSASLSHVLTNPCILIFDEAMSRSIRRARQSSEPT
jgi:ATP-binding cassette, subfamily B, bacterial HlyB/CyaB